MPHFAQMICSGDNSGQARTMPNLAYGKVRIIMAYSKSHLIFASLSDMSDMSDRSGKLQSARSCHGPTFWSLWTQATWPIASGIGTAVSLPPAAATASRTALPDLEFCSPTSPAQAALQGGCTHPIWSKASGPLKSKRSTKPTLRSKKRFSVA